MSRDETVLRGIGLEQTSNIWNILSRVFAYLTELLIVIGFISILTNRISVPLKKGYVMLTLFAIMFLAAVIIIPTLASTLNMTRFYHILLFLLAPLFAIGAEFLVTLVSKNRRELFTSMIIIILVPYFLFQSGFIYEITGTQSWSLSLSKSQMNFVFLHSRGYWDESEVSGAIWMSKNVDLEHTTTYSDIHSVSQVLRAYGMINSSETSVITNTTILPLNSNLYLNKANIFYNVFVGYHQSWNNTNISSIIGFANKVYSSGGSEIYKNNAGS
jgi:uncharacterized membrane protein